MIERGGLRVALVAFTDRVNAGAGRNPRGLALALSPDGQPLASADKDGHLRLWDMATRQPLRDPLLRHAGPVLALAWAPDGGRIASAGWDRGVMISRTRPADWAALACALVRHNPPAADAGTPTGGCTAPNRP